MSLFRVHIMKCISQHRTSGRFHQRPLEFASFGRMFSATTTSTQHNAYLSSKNEFNHRRISCALYRQLMRWCRSCLASGFPDEALEPLGIPPVHLQAPEEIDYSRMKLLCQIETNAVGDCVDEAEKTLAQRCRRLLPLKCDFLQTQQMQMVVPLLKVSDLKRFFQAIFRINNTSTRSNDEKDLQTYQQQLDYDKARRTAAFQALKSLNELELDKLPRYLDRNGVEFGLGQVVQSREERWRGVVIEWKRTDPNSRNENNILPKNTTASRFSTLTTKEYTLVSKEMIDDGKSTPPTSDSSSVSYTVLIDAGDAMSMESSLTRNVFAHDLERVEEPLLCRVRNHWMVQHFVRYCSQTRRFVPNALRRYQYPYDEAAVIAINAASTTTPDNASSCTTEEVTALCEEITTGIKEMAAKFNTLLTDSIEQNSPAIGNEDESTEKLESLSCDLLRPIQQKLQDICNSGSMIPIPYRFLEKIPPVTLTSFFIKALTDTTQEILEQLRQRRHSKEALSNVHMQLGNIVRHKKYGFRGVVVAWDPVPAHDVSRWDGLQDIKNPMDQPFYHILPDQNDCRRVFGGERPMRYVCQENIEELCNAEDVADMHVDADLDWKRIDAFHFQPPVLAQFKHGYDLGDNGAIDQCLESFADSINQWHFRSRQYTTDADVGGNECSEEDKDGSILQKISLQKLMKLLTLVDNVADAGVIEDLIKKQRFGHPLKELRWRLEEGYELLLNGKTAKAVDMFESVVAADSKYAEAWNKLGTSEFMLGLSARAHESTWKALELDQLHYQARNGLGLVLLEKQNILNASEHFRESLRLCPWSPVASKLSLCIDLLKGQAKKSTDDGRF